jgi:hypothetical protein
MVKISVYQLVVATKSRILFVKITNLGLAILIGQYYVATI